MWKSFSFWNLHIGNSLVRMRIIKGFLMLIIISLFVIKMKYDLNKAEQMCEGPDCVEINISFLAPPDYIKGVDKRKYQWVEIYKKDSKKVLYKRYFDNQNRIIFLVEKGEYYIKSDNKDQEIKEISVKGKKELILQ
jgi:hypothetical protein